MIGRVLGGRYEILERIGSGGMSVVYKAKCSYLQREVAVKILRERYADDADFLRNFRREARAAARLSHPNIVNIYDVGEDEDLAISYIIMEYISGRSLKELMRKKGQFDPQDAARIIDRVLSAVECAHSNGVIHRDIKPDNILIDENGRVKVADFGIARAQDTGTFVVGDQIIGSVRYMSPEQARGLYTDARSDLYSVAVVLYEMLTGHVPFDGNNTIGVAVQHMKDDPEPIDNFRNDVPKYLQDIVRCGLKKDPAHRFESASQMRESLKGDDEEQYSSIDSDMDDDTKVVSSSELRSKAPGRTVVSRRTERFDDNAEEPPDNSPPNKRSWKPTWTTVVWVALLLAAVGVVSYSAYWVYDWFAVPVVEVPEVVQERLATAEAVLEEHGLEAEIVASAHDDDVPANHVLNQRPTPGEQVRRGQTVELTISEGPQWVEGGVPEVIGRGRTEARIELENVGLTVEFREEYHDEIPSGHVIDQIPEEGSRVQEGATITLEISKGPEPRPFELHGYIGRGVSEAEYELEDLGLDVRTVKEPADFPEDLVVQQDPSPGTEVTAGDTVTLVVSEGNDEEPNEETININLQEEPAQQMIRVELIDSLSSRVVFHDRVEGGQDLDITLYWYGAGARAFVYSENSVIHSETFRD